MNLFSRLFRRPEPRRFPSPPASARELDAAVLQRQLNQTLTAKAQAERALANQRRPTVFTPGRELVVVLPFCAADEHRLRLLLDWIAELGQVPAQVLVIHPNSCPVHDELDELLRHAFAIVSPLRTPFDLPKEGWPIGPNWSFLTAATRCRQQRLDFLLLEPDCIPLRAGWFEALRDEYRACGLPYLGYVEPATGDYPAHLAGNAVYHHTVFHHFRTDKLGTAWDVAMAETLVPLTHRSRLIHQEFGPLDHPPTFQTVDDLRRLPAEAVLFHRSKDGGLIKVLREQRARKQP